MLFYLEQQVKERIFVSYRYMTNTTLQQIHDIIQNSGEAISTDLQKGKLVIRADKNHFLLFLSVIGVLLSFLLIATYNRAQYNLEIGVVLLWIATSAFWRSQIINKTLIIDLQQSTFSIVPAFPFQRWLLSGILKVELTYDLNSGPELHLNSYYMFKHYRTRRIHFKNAVWTIYLLEFTSKEKAQKVFELLTE